MDLPGGEQQRQKIEEGLVREGKDQLLNILPQLQGDDWVGTYQGSQEEQDCHGKLLMRDFEGRNINVELQRTIKLQIFECLRSI